MLGVIKGSASNHGGASSGYSVPNGRAQETLYKQALNQARLTADEVDVLEVHGTGTSLGDPIELSSVDHVYGQNRNQSDPLYISSVKTNVGHLEGAAGIVGLIKAILQLNDKTLYPHLNLDKPTGKFNWQDSGIKVPQELTDWPKRSDKRRIAVSSFGFSGTNAHVVLEEAPTIPERVNPEYQRPNHLLVLSAKSEKALDAQLEQYMDYLVTTDHSIGDILKQVLQLEE